MVFRARDKYFDTSEKPVVMGILNVTPDSFSDGGKYLRTENALEHCRMMIRSGAGIIDIGGESSRPGAKPVDADEEMERILPVIKAVSKEFDICISVDTYKHEVAEAALKEGAHMINNIFGTKNDERLLKTVKDLSAGLCIMHIRGTPENMQDQTGYTDIVSEVLLELKASVGFAGDLGIEMSNIAIDPGIGFGKTAAGNLEILNRLDEFRSAGCCILVGTSRKSFIAAALGTDDESRSCGTIAANVIAYSKGAGIFRVHDVSRNRKALDLAALIIRNSGDKYGAART